MREEHRAVAGFYEHLIGQHGYVAPAEFAREQREANAGGVDPERGTGRSTRAMLDVVARAGAAGRIVVVAPAEVAEPLAARIRDLQDMLGIVDQPDIERADSEADVEDGAIAYVDHAVGR